MLNREEAKVVLPLELREYWDELIMEVDTNIRLQSVILSEENKEKIERFIEEITHKDILVEYGLRPMNKY